mmetsp:Transcript_31733/g.42288  ORF Transcript_31733/g.42288 Transcript_31733/m.42288 type:complete len:175 (+) Transcript_31733:1-525(+)
MVMIVMVTISLLAILWQTKDIQDEFVESNWIFYGILAHLQAWVMALPIWFGIDSGSTNAIYLTAVVFLFIFSTALVVLVIWPKIFMWAHTKIYGESNNSKMRPRINLSGDKHVHISGLRSSQEGISHPIQPDTYKEQVSLLFAENSELKKEILELKQGQKTQLGNSQGEELPHS